MNKCGCMTRAEREAGIRKVEQGIAKLRLLHDPRLPEAEAALLDLKRKHQQIIDAGESCTHGLPDSDESNPLYGSELKPFDLF
jgi:hypothetical protein